MKPESANYFIDEQLKTAIELEEKRQKSHLELIASENYVSPAVREAAGSILTNKYAEGYPSKRYYGGCEYVDIVEELAIKRANNLFGSQFANVQPHSGSSANLAAFLSILKPGETFLGMDLSQGGHLTHGHKVNFSGTLFKAVSYGLSPETKRIDYDDIVKKIKEHKPKMIIAGASAYSRVIEFDKFSNIAKEFEIPLLVDMAHIAGLVAGGVHISPIPYADIVTTTTHKTLRGPRSGIILMKEPYAKLVNKWVFPGCQGGPLMHIVAAKAVALHEASLPEFKGYAKQVVANAKRLCSALISYGYEMVTGGTDNHLVLVDLTNKKITGKDADDFLNHCGITVNKNAIPFDPNPPMVTSGIRIGTAAVTTRGMKEKEMEYIASLIDEALSGTRDSNSAKIIQKKVKNLTDEFGVP